jgi:hypothetical protein
LIKKKDGGYRFAIDYRPLNNITERVSYPLPHIEETLNRLNGNNFPTKLHLKAGYHQMPIHPLDKEKTTFLTSNGTVHFNFMHQGLKNSPANFQRIMYDLVIHNRWDYCFVYINDILIFTRTFDEHMNHLNTIISVLYSANLQLHPSKCSFVQPEIDYLGHTINGQDIRPLKDNVDAILKIPIVSKQVHSFVQAAAFYRDHVPDFSKLAVPLFPYTQKNIVWKEWTESMDQGFHEIKRRLT